MKISIPIIGGTYDQNGQAAFSVNNTEVALTLGNRTIYLSSAEFFSAVDALRQVETYRVLSKMGGR